jgi:hypothetical protein
MALKARTWTDLDREAMRTIRKAWETMPDRPSQRAVAQAIGVTHPRIGALFAETGGTPTLEEFCDLCELVGLEPADVLQKAIDTTS